MKTRTLLAVACAVCAVSGYSASITSLGLLPGGTTATVTGCSGDGAVVLGYCFATNGKEAFAWRAATGMVGLGDLVGGGFASESRASNFDGSRIVGLATPNTTRAFSFTQGGGMVQMAALATNTLSSRAHASAESVVIGQSNSSGNGTRATAWIGSNTAFALPDLTGGSNFSDGIGVSPDGTKAVGWSSSANGFEACVWSGTNFNTITALGDLAGGSFDSEAIAVNNAGVIVGKTSNANGPVATVWNLGIPVALGPNTTSDPFFNSKAYDISESGIIVGTGAFPDGGAFIRFPDGSSASMKAHLASLGVDVSGWSLITDCRGISDDGTVVVGNGIFNGTITGFRAELSPAVATLAGQITVPGLSIPVSQILSSVEILDTGNPLLMLPITIDGSGNYSGQLALIGPYVVLVAAPGCLIKKSGLLEFTPGQTTNYNFELVLGDVDQDNEVGPGDFEMVVAQFGGSGDADVDRDGEVGPSDFEIVVQNFGLQGD